MEELILFTDGSVHTQSKIGYGAFLTITEPEYSIELLAKNVKVKRFQDTSSTKLELQTLLWALSSIEAQDKKIVVYTDSQNILSLPERREHFEHNDYRTRNGKRIGNYILYKEFFTLTDPLKIELIKTKGHQKTKEKSYIDQLFTLVDRASRNALRENMRDLTPD